MPLDFRVRKYEEREGGRNKRISQGNLNLHPTPGITKQPEINERFSSVNVADLCLSSAASGDRFKLVDGDEIDYKNELWARITRNHSPPAI